MYTMYGKEYLSELTQFLKYEAMSKLARYVMYPVILGLAIFLALGTAPANSSIWGLFLSFLGYILLELLFAVFLSWAIFTFVHPYDKVAQRNHQREIAKLLTGFKEECDKEASLRIAQENGLLRTELMKEYKRKHEEEMRIAYQHAADEQKRLEDIIAAKNQELKTKEQEYQNAVSSKQTSLAAAKERYDSETETLKSEIEQLNQQMAKEREDFRRELEETKERHDQELEDLRQKNIDGLSTDDLKILAEVSARNAINRKKLMKGLMHQVEIVGKYVVVELSKFDFSLVDIADFQLLFKTYVETSGGFDASLKSTLINKHKEEGGAEDWGAK